MAVELKPKDLAVPHKQVAQAGLATTCASLGEVLCMRHLRLRSAKKTLKHRRPLAIMHRNCNALGLP